MTSEGDGLSRRRILKGIGTSVTLGLASSLQGNLSPTTVSKEWEIQTGRPNTTAINCADSTLYYGSQSSVIALDESGELKWQTGLETGTPTAVPTVVNGRAFITSFTGVHSLSVGEGRKDWSYNASWGGGSPPVIIGSALYSIRRRDLVNEAEPKLLALDSETGDLLWEFQLSTQSWSQPAALGNSLFAADMDGNVYKINRKTGEEQWQQGLPTPITSSPAIHKDSVFVVTQDGMLYSLDVNTGAVRWNTSVGQPQAGSEPCINQAIIYQSHKSGLVAIDAITGAVKWAVDTGVITSDPVIRRGVLYHGSMNGRITARRISSGEIEWTAKFPSVSYEGMHFDGIRQKPTATANRLYFTHDSGNIYSLK